MKRYCFFGTDVQGDQAIAERNIGYGTEDLIFQIEKTLPGACVWIITPAVRERELEAPQYITDPTFSDTDTSGKLIPLSLPSSQLNIHTQRGDAAIRPERSIHTGP